MIDIVPQGHLPRIAIIVAMTRKGVIGAHGALPWHIPEELQLFKQVTTGQTVIMGHNTYKTIGRPLPQRSNLVLSRSGESIPGTTVCRSFMDALIVSTRLNGRTYIIGGRDVYAKALPLASELNISWIKHPYTGDVIFPQFDLDDWQSVEQADYREFEYVRYVRKSDLSK